jgi:hypothetical protein
MRSTLCILFTATAFLGLTACESTSSSKKHGSSHQTAARSGHHSSDHGAHDFDSNLRRLRIGMSRGQVNDIMDDRGDVLERNGNIEIVEYRRGFGSSYARALKSNYTFGLSGHEGANGAALTFRNGRLSHISAG